MGTVAIVGAGAVGVAAARALASSGRVGRVLLVDGGGDAAAGEALDIQQSGAIDGFHTRVEGTADATRVVGCAVCILADRFGESDGEWRGDEGLALLTRTIVYLGRAPIVFAGASQADLLAKAATEAGLERQRLMGSAPVALASSVSAIVAMEAGCSPAEVMLTVLGVPPAGFVVAWSGASIGGHSLPRVLSPVQLGRIEARVSRLWPPGAFGLGVSAAHVATALLSSARRSVPVLTWLTGEFGVRNRAGTVPARLGPAGIVQIREPELTGRERVQLQTALGE